MLLALSNQKMLGLGALAGLFIVFAVLSAFYFPRRNPDFPGNRLGLFTLVTVLLFVATMVGVVVFAKEEEEEGARAEAIAGEEAATETGATTSGEPAEATGDAGAGKAVFTSAGCGACHTLAAAGTSGAVGPNLDETKPDATLVVERVTKGQGVMPAFEGQLSDDEIENVAAYVVASTSG